MSASKGVTEINEVSNGGGDCLSSLKQYAIININQVRMALFISGDIHEGNKSAVLVFDIELGIETIS